MNERLKQLRKELKLTQQEFADILHVKQNTVASYESGRIIPSDMVIASICREFRASDTWIRTGEGEMFERTPKDAIDDLIDSYGLGPASEALIRTFCELRPEDRKVILNFVIAAADNIQNMDSVVEAAEAAYIKALGIAGKTDSSISNSSAGIQNTDEDLLNKKA